MKEITVTELAELQQSKSYFQLIDVREPNEVEICEIGGELIPMGVVSEYIDRFSRDKKVIVHCRSGKRSGDVILYLEQNHGFENLYNLKGGILAYADEIDSSLTKY